MLELEFTELGDLISKHIFSGSDKTSMFRLLLSLIGFWSFAAFAVPCDCEVRVHSPLTGPHKMEPVVIKTYQLEEFSNFSIKNVQQCRTLCLEAYEKDIPADRLSALLVTYSMQLIEQKAVGYNCTGLTTLKYPVRVKARLGAKGLGNVADVVQVISHEEVCF